MKRNNQTVKGITFFLVFNFFVLISGAQVKQITWFASEDVTIGSGTENGTNETVVGSAQLQLCNFDSNDRIRSYMESWVKFDLRTILDSIPDGFSIQYAEIKFRVTANANKQGLSLYHLFDIDDWDENTLTWDKASAYDFENPNKHQHISSIDAAGIGNTSARPTANVTEQILNEIEEGNKILTFRLEPLHKEYVEGVDNTSWLGFYSRESTWDKTEYDPFNISCPQLIITMSPEQPKVFSEFDPWGDISKYKTSPERYGYWMVQEDEEDLRLSVSTRPSPINKTPGALALLEDDYLDFDIHLKAKAPNIFDSDKSDFVVVFDYMDAKNYSYFFFIGNDDCGFYSVIDGDGYMITTNSLAPAITDNQYHEYVLSRSGNDLTVTIDGENYYSTSNSNLAKGGKIGFGTYNDIAFFDDVYVGEINKKNLLLNTISQSNNILKDAVIGFEAGNFSQESYDMFNKAIQNANTIYSNANASDTEIESATNDLKEAKETFYASQITNKDKLAEKIANAESLVDSASIGTEWRQFHENDVTTFIFAINNAKIILNNNYSTDNNLTKAINNLDAALKAFSDSQITFTDIFARAAGMVDDDALGTQVGQYPHEAYDEFMHALQKFSTVNESNTDEQGLLTAVDELNAAVAKLIESQLTYHDILENEILTSKDLINTAEIGEEIGQYPQEAYNTFNQKIEDAAAALNNDTTEAGLNSAINALHTANTAFEESLITIEDILKEQIDYVQVILQGVETGPEVGQYPQEAIDSILLVINDAKSILNDSTATDKAKEASLALLENETAQFFDAQVTYSSVLESSVLLAQSKLDSAIMGTEEGQYPQEAIELLNTAITATKETIENINSTDEDIQESISYLAQKIEEFYAMEVSGINEITDNELVISPNPAQNNILIQSGSIISDVSIYNLLGQLSKSKYYIQAQSAQIDISELKNGIYLVQIIFSKDETRIIRLIKK